MLRKSTFREIRNSIERYIAILAIVALGVGFFSGLKVTKASMLSTCTTYLDKCSFYDYQLVTAYGIDEESVRIAEEKNYVDRAEASFEKDILVGTGDGAALRVYKAISLPEAINVPQLKAGRMPEADNECVVDDYASAYRIGDSITLSEVNDEDAIKTFKYKEYKVVGRVSSPLYLDYQRGTTDLGDGTLSSFMYIPYGGFDTDYYTALYVKLKGSEEFFGDSADDVIKSRKKSVKALAAEINDARRESAMAEAQKTLDEKKAEYEDGLAEYNRQKASATNQMNSAEATLNNQSKNLAAQKTQLTQQLATLQSQKAQAESGLAQLNGMIAQLEALGEAATPEQLQQLAYLKAQAQTVAGQLAQINDGIAQINAGLAQITDGEKAIASGKSELARNRRTADSEFAKAKKELDDAKEKLDEAQEQIDDMKAGKSYVFTRDDNTGFSVFDENAGIVDGIAKVFPLFFFLVAALVCMTTMTRMIDEHRTQIGILKALGYSNGAVLSKYMFYSGSAAFIGAVGGFFAGCKIFPAVIWNAYGMMYDFEPKVEYIINWKLGIIVLIAALMCSMGATWVSCASDFGVAPSDLIRPKSPAAGKRILLERIPFIWNRIGFLRKVSIRNTFRYKKRFFMMVLGISGCTALLIAGMGINTTVKRVAEFQFKEVLNYDYLLAFNDNMDDERQKEFISYSDEVNDGRTGEILFLHEASAKVQLDGGSVDVALVATDDERINDFVNLHDGSRHLDYPKDGEVLICRELQQRRGVEVGDTISIKDGYRTAKVKVVGVCDNYVRNYVYMTESTYRKDFGKAPSIKMAFVMSPDSATDDQIREAATALKQSDEVAAASVNLDTIDMVNKMMRSLDAVVLVVILCAGLLAFIVLYNLTNINITERIREVATIKVLGFYDKETQQYVFRENYILTGIAALVGIPLGKWLLDFVISKICVNTIFFVPRITALDYVVSVVLTFVFAVIVNFAMRRRLRNVSMTESLKSIE